FEGDQAVLGGVYLGGTATNLASYQQFIPAANEIVSPQCLGHFRPDVGPTPDDSGNPTQGTPLPHAGATFAVLCKPGGTGGGMIIPKATFNTDINATAVHLVGVGDDIDQTNTPRYHSLPEGIGDIYLFKDQPARAIVQLDMPPEFTGTSKLIGTSTIKQSLVV